MGNKSPISHRHKYIRSGFDQPQYLRRSRLRQLRGGPGFQPADIPWPWSGEAPPSGCGLSNPALTTDLGSYTLSSADDDLNGVSSILDYLGKPTAWNDGRSLICEHRRCNSTCGVKFHLLSNQHLEDGTERMRSQIGVLTGPICGAFGKAYIQAPEESAFNGANAREGAKDPGIRLIHKPCRGKKGARFTVSIDHARQKHRSDNIRILSELVKKVAINGLRRVLAPALGASEAGMARIYDRIFWLERLLLAYQRAQLAQLRARLAKQARQRHTRIAHDGIVLTVNWETAKGMRVTNLNCAVSADIQSGYVFRIQVDFDPTADPVSLLDALFFDQDKVGDSLRKVYTRANGEAFIAPCTSFQRPTGRFDELALFASAVAQLRVFADRAVAALERSVAPAHPSTLEAIDEASERANALEMIGNYYFNFGAPEREGRNAFTGIMTRNTYTKAAHLGCLKEMLPEGKLTLVGKQEASMARIVTHIFRDEIVADRFEWHVATFDKDAKKPQIVRRTNAFDDAFRAFPNANPKLMVPDPLDAWTRTQLKPATKDTKEGASRAIPESKPRLKGLPGALDQEPDPGERRDEEGHRVSDPIAALPRRLPQARVSGPDHRPRAHRDSQAAAPGAPEALAGHAGRHPSGEARQ